jgi:flagella basal body P-ring formation protein FlgA
MRSTASLTIGLLVLFRAGSAATVAASSDLTDVRGTVPDRVEVRGESITLGDLLGGNPASPAAAVRLGYAPNPGHYRWISRTELQGMLARAGVTVEAVELPERVLVTRAAGRLAEGLIETTVRNHYLQAWPAFSVTIEELEAPRDLVLPEGQVEVRVDARGTPARLDGVTLKVDLLVDGKLQRSHWARVRAKARGKVAVVRRPLSFGQTVQSGDVELMDQELVDLEGCLSSLEGLDGLVARRPLAPGAVLRLRDLQRPLLVRAGDIVTLTAVGPTFSISASARARQAGRQGESILVQNLDSREVVTAKVVGTGEVRIDLAGGR